MATSTTIRMGASRFTIDVRTAGHPRTFIDANAVTDPETKKPRPMSHYERCGLVETLCAIHGIKQKRRRRPKADRALAPASM